MFWKCKMLLKKVIVWFSNRVPWLITDENYSKLLYFVVFGRHIDLQRPLTFNEHIIVKKLENIKYSYAKFTDKYEVREYVKKCVGEKYLNPMYGIYDNFDEIDFSILPEKFALKATHASGFNIIITDKNNLDISKARKKFRKWLKTNFYYKDREKNYFNIKPRILCDKYIQFDNELVEYKLYCFNAKVRFICQNIDKNGRRYTNVLDENFNTIPVRFGYDNLKYPITEKSQELVCIAEKLASPFGFVRVDLYENKGEILFSELTFHSGGGLVPFDPEYFDYEFGKFFEESKGDN